MSKNLWIMVVGGFLLLAVAVFIGSRLLASGSVGKGNPGGMLLGGDGQMQNISIDVQNAKELPEKSPDLQGMLVRKENDSLYVTQITGMMGSAANGPEIEVVVTPKTVVYRDATMDTLSGPPDSGQAIQQVVELGSAEDMAGDDMVMVWGEKRGDRYVAEVVVYSRAVIISR